MLESSHARRGSVLNPPRHPPFRDGRRRLGVTPGTLILGKLTRDVAPSRDCHQGLSRGLVLIQTSLTSETTSSPYQSNAARNILYKP